jgi:transposase
MIAAKDNHFRFDVRRRLVAYARAHGIKATARAWRCSRNTVRLWLGRYEREGLAGLKERSHAPHGCPHKTPAALEQRILTLRERTGYGARRLKAEFDLPCGHQAISRILRVHQLTRKPRTKGRKKNDLRAVKAMLRAFETINMDIKYLNDIPHYLAQMELKGLPRYQYSARDVRTGLLFVAFADRVSKSHACACAERLLRHLQRHQVDLAGVAVQTDNGGEFDGQLSNTSRQGFAYTLEQLGAGHRSIPPGCPNANADVETTHGLIETEFYDREDFRGPQDFFAKSWTYQCHFNFTRKNSYQRWRTPIERLGEAAPDISAQVALLPPIHLDTLLPAAPKRRRYREQDEILINLAGPSAHTPSHVSPPTAQGGQHQPGYPVMRVRRRRGQRPASPAASTARQHHGHRRGRGGRPRRGPAATGPGTACARLPRGLSVRGPRCA